MKFILAFIALLFFQFNLQGQHLDVMTYNIRFQTENDGENSWSKRKDHLTNQIKFYEPQIMGVQEALVSQLKHFEAQMPDYKYIGVGRDDGKEAGEFSAIFYDLRKVDILDQGTFWLSESPEKVSVGWDAAMERV